MSVVTMTVDNEYRIIRLDCGATVRIKEGDEGLVVDVWDNADENVVGSIWFLYHELEVQDED